jgi:hypothetical protein
MIAKCIKGKWRIVEMPTWGADHLNLLGPAHIEFDGKGGGEIAFGALQATLECAATPSGIDFHWYGFDEMDEVPRRGLGRTPGRPLAHRRVRLRQRRRIRTPRRPVVSSSTAC